MASVSRGATLPPRPSRLITVLHRDGDDDEAPPASTLSDSKLRTRRPPALRFLSLSQLSHLCLSNLRRPKGAYTSKLLFVKVLGYGTWSWLNSDTNVPIKKLRQFVNVLGPSGESKVFTTLERCKPCMSTCQSLRWNRTMLPPAWSRTTHSWPEKPSVTKPRQRTTNHRSCHWHMHRPVAGDG